MPAPHDSSSVSATAVASSSDLRIGDWVLHPALNQLIGPEDEVHLEPRTAAVLLDLAHHAGEVRTREELLDSVWGDAFVGEAVLTHSIWELRRALGDEARNPRYIQTIPRRGYRLVASVQPVDDTVLQTLLLVQGSPPTSSTDPVLDRLDAVESTLDEILTELGATTEGLPEEWGDGLLLCCFERPAEAVQLALRLRLATADAPVRCAVHLAELPSQVQEAFGKEPEAPLLPARQLLSLAEPGQILLSAAAFELARRAPSAAADDFPYPLRWLAHGGYTPPPSEPGVPHSDTEALLIFEVGFEGLSPLRPPAAAAGFRPTHGDGLIRGWRAARGLPVPQRDAWTLERKLGEGGFGEIWLALHQNSGDGRVFKFCYHHERLRALQREVSLLRLLKESLGQRRDIVRILDWQFESAPYFLELEHATNGSLLEWADSQGGLAEVSLKTRLEILAHVADALAAAHSVGVLHKDIKPSNVLIAERRPGPLQVRLTDFGIGQVTDLEAFQRAGITALGLTETQASSSSSSGTRLYQAPEVIEGRPFSIAADLYALGVMLYQLVTASPTRALATGWERDVEDELLRDLIARCVDLDPQRRPDGAAEIARALRTLEERRQRLHSERQARAQANADRQALTQSRRRRRRLGQLTAAIFAVLVVVSFLALRAHDARQEADAARQRAEQRQQQAEGLIGFMLEDLRQKLEPVGQLEILDTVGDQALAYFDAVPEEDWSPDEHLHRAQALRQIGEVRMAQGDLKAALEAFEASLVQVRAAGLPFEAASAPAYLRQIEALHRIGQAQRLAGDLEAANTAFSDALEIAEGLAAIAPPYEPSAGAPSREDPSREDQPGEEPSGEEQPDQELVSVSRSEIDIALTASLFWVGQELYDRRQLDQALPYFQRYREIAESWVQRDPSLDLWQLELIYATSNLGSVFDRQGAYPAAVEAFQRCLETHRVITAQRPDDATAQMDLALANNTLGAALTASGELSQAETHYRADHEITTALVSRDPANTAWQQRLAITHFYLGENSWHQGRLEEAEAHFRQQLDIALELRSFTNAHWQREVAVAQLHLGQVHSWQKRYASAQELLQSAFFGLDDLVTEVPENRDWVLQLSRVHVALGMNLLRSSAAEPGLEEPRRHAQAALELAEGLDLPDPALQARALLLQGSIDQSVGDLEAARRSWTAALRFLPQPDPPRRLHLAKRALRAQSLLLLRDPGASGLQADLEAIGYRGPELQLAASAD
ncbi:MAG: protein kinase [Acidobacteriota bacterium]